MHSIKCSSLEFQATVIKQKVMPASNGTQSNNYVCHRNIDSSLSCQLSEVKEVDSGNTFCLTSTAKDKPAYVFVIEKQSIQVGKTDN